MTPISPTNTATTWPFPPKPGNASTSFTIATSTSPTACMESERNDKQGMESIIATSVKGSCHRWKYQTFGQRTIWHLDRWLFWLQNRSLNQPCHFQELSGYCLCKYRILSMDYRQRGHWRQEHLSPLCIRKRDARHRRLYRCKVWMVENQDRQHPYHAHSWWQQRRETWLFHQFCRIFRQLWDFDRRTRRNITCKFYSAKKSPTVIYQEMRWITRLKYRPKSGIVSKKTFVLQ